MREFYWMNESRLREENEGMSIYAPAGSDFFLTSGPVNEEGITPGSMHNAPFYFTEVSGDFVLRVKVRHEFQDTYDACAIMVMKDLSVWAKACFEKTDFGTHAVVSVVTKGESDDANGCDIEGREVWLQAARVGNAFAFHYSLDGERFFMMRYFVLPAGETVKAGLVAQSPMGRGGERYFEHLLIQERTVKNIRAGQ